MSSRNDREIANPLNLIRHLAGSYDPIDGIEASYSQNRAEGKHAAALTAVGRTRGMAEKYIRYAPQSYHEALWEAYAYSLSADKLGIAKAFNYPDPLSGALGLWSIALNAIDRWKALVCAIVHVRPCRVPKSCFLSK